MITITIAVFIFGYLGIATEHAIKIDKAAIALITGVLCWSLFIMSATDKEKVSGLLAEHLGEISGILFFLLGAMTIVELIDAHDGFNIITEKINQTNKVKLLWTVSMITFFLSPLLDNLTTTIVMVSLLRKLINDGKDRLLFTGMVIIASNAGGAWSPIGDVTTTMMWLGGQITASGVITHLLLPSLICLIAPLTVLSFVLKGNITQTQYIPSDRNTDITRTQQYVVFLLGTAVLIFVPIFKTLTHLPPYMGMLMGLGVVWFVTEIIHGRKLNVDKNSLSVSYALRKIDAPSILFFLGILLSISALESIGVLKATATWMAENIKNQDISVMSIGLLSAVIDNVPLVAATQGMFSLDQYPTDHYFWLFLAYATGTGGSALIIGSAAGVAAMGMEKIKFFWYLKNITWLALLGYFAGAVAFILLHKYFFSSWKF